MTCNDCLYCEKCYSRIRDFMDVDEGTGKLIADIEKRCASFKNKADFVEVVRCEKCLYKVDYKGRVMCRLRAKEAFGSWIGLTATMNEDYCRYGEKRE